jgi:hypothetical protein
MATITSAQSGYWDDPTTWVGGSVPDLSVDDVVVADYHTVTADSSSRTLVSGRQITVNQYGVLEVWSDLLVESGASIYTLGGLTVSTYVEVQGYLHVAGTGWLDDYGTVAVIYGGTVEVSGSASVYPYAYFDVVYGSSLHVYGSFHQDWSAYSTFYQGAYVAVEISGSAYFDGYLYVEDYSTFHVYGDAYFDYSVSAEVRYNGELHVESGGSLSIASYLNLMDSGYLYVRGDMTLDGYLYVYGYSQVYVESGGTLTINGYANVEYYSTFTVNGGTVNVSRWGGLEAYYYGTIYFDYQSRIDLFGSFRLYYDAYLYLGSEAIVRVLRGMDISGQMDSGGGKFVMLRRDGRINDADGDSLFVFDQAYGFEPHLVA